MLKNEKSNTEVIFNEKQYNYQKSDMDFYEVVFDAVENHNNFKESDKVGPSA